MTRNRFADALLAALACALLHATPVLAHDEGKAHDGLAHDEGQAQSATAFDSRRTLTGTVHTLVIDDPVHGTSTRHVELQLDDGTLVPLRGDDTQSLNAGARASVTGRYNGKWMEVAAAGAVAGAPASPTKANAEIEGTFAVLHADDFAHGRSAFIYEVHQASGKVNRLHLGTSPAGLAPGMRLRVAGHAEADGESLTPDHITILAQPASSLEAPSTIAKAATVNSVLVIMANFSNTIAPAFTTARAQQVMTSNADSVANFFREGSYGQQVMSVTVTPSWVTMSMARPASCGTADWQHIGSSAEAAAKSLGAAYDPAAYKFVVYVFPTVATCDWIGLAYIGDPHKAWINGAESFKTAAIAHEMGHNFGLLHAASLRCGSGAIGGSCTASEYGDPFDTMGNQRAMHYNAMQKSKLAWIASTAVKTHTGGSATYTLSPLEVAGGTTYAVKIPTGSANRTYWLEFRQPIGFDGPLAAFPNDGAQIRVATPFETLCGGCDTLSDDTQLLDTTPATTAFTDATLTAGRTFSDATYGINVTVLAASASAMTVQVATGSSSPPAPAASATTLIATPNPSLTNAIVTFTATVTGAAPTGTVAFDDSASAVAGCGAVGLGGTGNVRTARCSTTALASGNHSIVARYSGDAANAASASGTLVQTVNAPANGTNVALAANGGVASASSVHAGYAVDGIIDNRRSGAQWGIDGGWNDATRSAFPDWVQIDFDGLKAIDHVVLYTLQDNYRSPVEPTDSMRFSLYGITDFQVQGWNGANWVTLGSVSGNDLVKRTVSFAAFTTDRIRIYVTGSRDGAWSRITEVEAWTSTVEAPMTNYASASSGGVATASSMHDAGFSPSGANDNRRAGANWGHGGGWNDASLSTYPDWLQVDFNGRKTIDNVVVYTLQDDYTNPVEPTDAMTFTRYGVTSFDVQAWDGTAWVTLGGVTDNRFVKRVVSFSPYTTDRIRVRVRGTADARWSRITEVEAWGR